MAGATNLISKILSSLIGLVTLPLTIELLGKEIYGLWMLIGSIVVWMQLSDLGIGKGLVNVLSEDNGRGDMRAASEHIISAIILIGLVCVATTGVAYLAYVFLPWSAILNIQGEALLLQAKQCVLLMGLFFIANLWLGLIVNIFMAFQRSNVNSFYQMVASLLNLVLLLVAVKFEFPFHWFVIAMSLPQTCCLILLWLHFIRTTPWFTFKDYRFTRASLTRISATSVPLFLFQIGAMLVNQLVNVVLAHVAGLTMVADYNVLLRVYLLVFSIGSGIAYPFYPAVREAFEKSEVDWVKQSVVRAVAIRCGVSLFAVVPLLFRGDFIIEIWIKQELQTPMGGAGWAAFGLTLLLSSLGSTLSEVLTVLDDIWSQIRIVFVNAVLTILGLWVIVPRLGLSGVYMAVFLASLYPTVWAYGRVKKGIQST